MAADPSHSINTAQIASIQEYTKTATSNGTAAGLFSGINDTVNMGKEISKGVFNINSDLISSLETVFSIPQGVLTNVGDDLACIAQRAASPVAIGLQNVSGISDTKITCNPTEFKGLGHNVLDASAGISTGKEKPVSVQY